MLSSPRTSRSKARRWRPLRAIFAARAPGPCVLAIGYRETLAGPMLDAPAMLAARYRSRSSLRYLLWGVLAAVIIGLAWMAWRMSLQMRQSPSPATDGDAQ